MRVRVVAALPKCKHGSSVGFSAADRCAMRVAEPLRAPDGEELSSDVAISEVVDLDQFNPNGGEECRTTIPVGCQKSVRFDMNSVDVWVFEVEEGITRDDSWQPEAQPEAIWRQRCLLTTVSLVIGLILCGLPALASSLGGGFGRRSSRQMGFSDSSAWGAALLRLGLIAGGIGVLACIGNAVVKANACPHDGERSCGEAP
mmetsp:Transcript_46570/g.134161  ORF Transcript_46570/g.134161 Transcript_46570/m.134161 type:complete len:201 (+) Transcript_46570:3-605(+)